MKWKNSPDEILRQLEHGSSDFLIPFNALQEAISVIEIHFENNTI